MRALKMHSNDFNLDHFYYIYLDCSFVYAFFSSSFFLRVFFLFCFVFLSVFFLFGPKNGIGASTQGPSINGVPCSGLDFVGCI